MNLQELKKIIVMKEHQFKKFGDVLMDEDNLLIYKDNNSKILGVAHLDTVIESPRFLLEHGNFIFSPQLDDRLGVYTLLYELPKIYNINLDILLTTGEERMSSTAIFFTPVKEYNWIVEFDRMGDGCVYYQYDDPKWLSILKKFFGKVSYGSYSDIAIMDFLGVCGVNIGVGYADNHRVNAYAIKSVYEKQIKSFVDFYYKYKSTKFKYEPRKVTTKEYTFATKVCILCGVTLNAYEKQFYGNKCQDCTTWFRTIN